MVLTAIRGAVGFLTRLPLGHDDRSWDAFRTTPATFPITGYLVGGLLVIPLLLPGPVFARAFVFLVWLYALTGITHVDGLADLGDAVAAHGDTARRRQVLKDTTTGVGALLLVGIVLIGVTLAAIVIAPLPWLGLLIVVSAEVSAKLSMAILACVGTASHDGLGAALTTHNTPRGLFLPIAVALPATVLTWPHPAAAVTLLVSPLVAVALWRWANAALGGINGDVIGASNEITRVVALHLGGLTWMLY